MQKKLQDLLKKSRKTKGFTLIEMVIVIAIIAILLLLIVPSLTKQKDRAKDRTNDAFRTTIQTQVELADDKNVSLESLAKDGYITDKQLKEAQDKGITVQNGKVVESGKNKAFSLVEAVIVLFIFCLIFTIPSLNLKDFKNKVQIESTRKQVKSVIDHYARQAVITNKGYKITCFNSAHEININDGKKTKIIKIDPEVEILNLSGVWISPKGSMTPRTIAIMCHEKRETIKVQMKWGRMIDG